MGTGCYSPTRAILCNISSKKEMLRIFQIQENCLENVQHCGSVLNIVTVLAMWRQGLHHKEQWDGTRAI